MLIGCRTCGNNLDDDGICVRDSTHTISERRIEELERENATLRRAVIEFKCPTCLGARVTYDSTEWWQGGVGRNVPCPTCTPLMSALEGLCKA